MNVSLKLIALVMSCGLVAGCQSSKIHSTGITAETRPPVCTVWKGISYSAKHDTPETVSEVRANNAARAAYCK